MTAPLLLPTSSLVGRGWLTLALPDVGVGARLPVADDPLRAKGFVRAMVVGGDMDRELPVRRPVIGAECWVPPAVGSDRPPWNHAEQIAARVAAATYDRALTGVTVDLSGVGDYAPAHVLTVIPLGEPQRVPDPSNWARFDVDLLLTWTTA